MRDIAIIGAGGFGREIKQLVVDINRSEPTFNLIGFYDDKKNKGASISNLPVLGTLNALNEVSKPLAVIVAIGNPVFKKQAVEKISNPLITFPTIIHPTSLIGSDNTNIGKGCIVCAGCHLTCDITLKDFVTLNLNCVIGHDSILNNYVSIMSASNISGEVILGDAVYVGTGATIINKINIGQSTTVGAGSVVYNSLPEKCTAIGIPAKPIMFHDKS